MLTVLLIEDNPGDVMLFKRHVFESQQVIRDSLRLITASSMEDARDKIKAADILIVDLSLHGSGMEEILREVVGPQSKNRPVFVWSGTDDISVATMCGRNGAASYFVKGVTSWVDIVRQLCVCIGQAELLATRRQERGKIREELKRIDDTLSSIH